MDMQNQTVRLAYGNALLFAPRYARRIVVLIRTVYGVRSHSAFNDKHTYLTGIVHTANGQRLSVCSLNGGQTWQSAIQF